MTRAQKRWPAVSTRKSIAFVWCVILRTEPEGTPHTNSAGPVRSRFLQAAVLVPGMHTLAVCRASHSGQKGPGSPWETASLPLWTPSRRPDLRSTGGVGEALFWGKGTRMIAKMASRTPQNRPKCPPVALGFPHPRQKVVVHWWPWGVCGCVDVSMECHFQSLPVSEWAAPLFAPSVTHRTHQRRG